MFCRVLLRNVSFKHILQVLHKDNKNLKFKNIEFMTSEVFKEMEKTLKLLNLQGRLADKELSGTLHLKIDMQNAGISCRRLKCSACNGRLVQQVSINMQLYRQMYSAELEDITVFQCPQHLNIVNHAYHARCVKKFIANELSVARR